MAQRRLVAWVPQWALHVAQADYPPDAPTALATGRAILDASPAAIDRGVRPGMRVRQARTLVPDLVLLPPDPDRAARAFDRVIHALTTLRWDVTAWRPGLAHAPLGALTSAPDEDRLLADATEAIAFHTGADARIGIADGTLAGLVAAHRGVRVPPDQQRAFLAPLTLDWLPQVYAPGPARRDLHAFTVRLRDLGLTHLHHLQDLPAGSLAARYGHPGHLVATLAAGADWPLDAPSAREDTPVAAHVCDPPLHTTDHALFLAKNLADTLLATLSSRGLTLTRLRITCTLGPGVHHARTWLLDPPATTADILTRVRWHLSAWLADPTATHAGIDSLALTATSTLPLCDLNPTLWGGDDTLTHARRAHAAAARLGRLVGREGVCAVYPQGGFDPRSRAVVCPWDEPPPPLAPTDAAWVGALAHPEPVIVYDEPAVVGLLDDAGAPVRVTDQGALTAVPVRIVLSLADHLSVAAVAGPYPVNGAWWQADDPLAVRSRAYLVVQVHDGPDQLLVYQDDQWWREGSYAHAHPASS